MRHLKRSLTKVIALENVPDVSVEQHFDHLRVSEAASLVHWVVAVLVLTLLLLFNELHVRGVFKAFAQDQPDDFFLVILNADQER